MAVRVRGRLGAAVTSIVTITSSRGPPITERGREGGMVGEWEGGREGGVQKGKRQQLLQYLHVANSNTHPRSP